jgi:predicted unusual protein kinase regulating ubiquinone biosynthesis (AarF/ABC1/UbiB family)
MTQTPKTETKATGVTKKHKVAPIPPEQYTNGSAASSNGKTSNGAVPLDVGVRIPISIRPLDEKTSDSSPQALVGAVRAAIPDVMADEIQPRNETIESVEQKTQGLRPKNLFMQLRYLYTLLFALWLFGRLIFWQVYVAKIFPDWVRRGNTRRWQKYAREFRNFALRMGGVQIKAGQFASTRADIMPEEVIQELADLQDKVPVIAFKRIQSVIESELGQHDEYFEHVDPEPVAAASLGQVHRAKLKSGESVVIKVQRPNVRDIVYTDMAALFIVGHVAMRFSFVSRRADAIMIIEEFGRVLLEEISYIQEAKNAQRFAAQFATNNKVYVPKIYEEHSTDLLLVMEDVTSIKIDDYERLAAAGIDRKDVAERLMDTYMQQIFEDRFFHADPHPGNLFVYPLPVEDESQYIVKGGRPYYLIFIDFGMTATLTREIVQGLINTLTALITRDAQKLVDSYQELGFLLPGADTQRIIEATKLVFDEVWGMNMSEIRDLEFEVVGNIGKEFNDLLHDMPFRLPQDFVYLGRTMGILTGMTTKLDPNYNPWTEIQGRVQHLITSDEEHNIWDEFGKIIEDSLNEIIADGPQGFIRIAERLINRFQRISRTEQLLQQLIDGKISLETKISIQERRQLERIEIQGKRSSRMMVVGSLLVCATLLYTNGDLPLAGAVAAVAGIAYISSWFIRQ